MASRCLTKLLCAALCNAHKLSSLTSLPIKQAGVMRFHDFWGTCENQPMFTEDSEDKPNYTPVSRSIYFLVFCALPSSFQNLAHIQPRTAPHWISPPVRACTFLQLWVLGVCQRRRICSCARATPLPAPGACCLTWILLLHSVISGKKYGSENWEFMR